MENLTPITLPQLDVEALAERAATIRDAINAKSVSAQQVGALFYDLVECCGNVRDALSLFINSNLPEIQQDIDRRLAGVDSAVEKAAAELQKSEAAPCRTSPHRHSPLPGFRDAYQRYAPAH